MQWGQKRRWQQQWSIGDGKQVGKQFGGSGESDVRGRWGDSGSSINSTGERFRDEKATVSSDGGNTSDGKEGINAPVTEVVAAAIESDTSGGIVRIKYK